MTFARHFRKQPPAPKPTISLYPRTKERMRAWGIPEHLLVWHPGWFEQTVPAAAEQIGAIAVLRLDGDLYSSTQVCLRHLLPKLSAGGWCVIDDFDLAGCRRAVFEEVGSFGPVYFQRHP